MPSIIELVSQAEEEAAALKKEAQAKAKEQIAASEAEAAAALERAHSSGRERVLAAQERAEEEGARIAEKVREVAASKADAQVNAAREKLPEAAKYILERVVKA